MKIGPLQITEFKANGIFGTPILRAVSRRILFRENEHYKNEKVYAVPERVVHNEEIMDTKIVYRS